MLYTLDIRTHTTTEMIDITASVDSLIESVDKTDVGFAGEWGIIGTPSAELAVNFTLPANMVTIDSSATMPLTFTSTDASYEDGTGGGQTAPAGSINPIWPSTQYIGAGGTLDVWIGGTVLPAISQTAGDYSADIILTVAYTGG